MRKIFQILLLSVIILLSAGCAEKQAGGTSLLKIDRSHSGYVKVDVVNPWKKGQTLHTYLLVPRDSDLPGDLPEGTVVRTPLRNVLVYSDVYARPIDELGCAGTVKSVCDAPYFKTRAIVEGLASGAVTDCGSSMAPSVERIAGAKPEAIILSPMENAGYGVLENLGIPIIEMADYMEASPLNRAKWIEFIGLLYGKEKEAAEIYGQVKNDYEALVKAAGSQSSRPTVISETVTGGVWYVPGGNSYKAALFRDTGASYPWEDDTNAGSLALDFPQVLDKGKDADFWLVTVYGYDLTKKALLDIYPHNGQFRAVDSHGVYYVDSAKTPIFEETPFHPERLLKDLIKIFHPSLLPDYQLTYYKPMTD